MSGAYYHTQESVKEYVQLAADVNGLRLIQKLRTYLSPGASLLELGSGPGTDWRILRETYDVTGSDYSEEFLAHLRSRNPQGGFLHLDAASLDTDQSYDGIYSNKVLHHLKGEALKLSIQRQATILKSGGIICHSFWKGEGTEIFKGLFVNYHEEGGLRKAFAEYFDVLVLEAYPEFEEGDSLLLIARRKAS